MVTFTRTVHGSYNEETGEATPVVSTITGTAVRGRGDPHRYTELGLVESKSPTLWFVPRTYGDTPAVGDVVEWESEDYTARDVEAIAPDGVTIAAKVIISQ